MTRIVAAAAAAMLAVLALAVGPNSAEAGYWNRRHVVFTPVMVARPYVVAPVGVIGASQLGSAFYDYRYGSYSPYYYNAPMYGYYHGPTYYYSRPAYFYGAPVQRARRVVRRTRAHCNCYK